MKAKHIRDIFRNRKIQYIPALYVAAVLGSIKASINCSAWFLRSRRGLNSNMLGTVSIEGRLVVGTDDGSDPSSAFRL